jgi:DNA-binding response OmpR family regulator
VFPTLIVTSRLADDELWAEVLNLGAYDVLAQPFDPDEVYRVVFLAWQHSKNSHPPSPQRAHSSKTEARGLTSGAGTSHGYELSNTTILSGCG